MNKKIGFTLAEVLITLGIIGVVAAMTIPTLMNQTGQAEFKSGFKKVISTLSQAITMNVALNSSDFSNLSDGDPTTDATVGNMFNSRMNVIKLATNAAPTEITGGHPEIDDANYTFFFNDGMVLSFPATCGGTALTGADSDHVCKAVVDVNGSKKPNKLTNCTGSATVETDDGGTCDSAGTVIGDRFSVRFFNQQILPNGVGARYVMYN